MNWNEIYAHFSNFRGELNKIKQELNQEGSPSSKELEAKIETYQVYLDVLKEKLIEMGMDRESLD